MAPKRSLRPPMRIRGAVPSPPTCAYRMNMPSPRAVTQPTLALVAAVASNGVIGARNGLPWRLAEDMRHFRTLTSGHAIVMGRRTWQSIGRPLPDRQNIVVTRQQGLAAAGIEFAASLDAALACVRLPQPVFCIGGGELYAAALPLADRLHLTEISRAFEGDTFFPPYDRLAWREVAREPCPGPDGLACAFVTYDRVTIRAAPVSP